MDNLQSITYQTFEQDPVKYAQYEEVGRYILPPTCNYSCGPRPCIMHFWTCRLRQRECKFIDALPGLAERPYLECAVWQELGGVHLWRVACRQLHGQKGWHSYMPSRRTQMPL